MFKKVILFFDAGAGLKMSQASYTADARVPHAGSFVFLDEDHTLGNLLRVQLLRDPDVVFAGYKLPHPLEPRIVLNVRTKPTTSPTAVLREGTQCLVSELRALRAQLETQVAQVTHRMSE